MSLFNAPRVLARLSTLILLAATSHALEHTSEKADANKGKTMKIVTVLRDNDCGSDAIARMKQVAARLGIDITIEEVIVENEDQARALRWPGSPTVRIKGLDIDPKARENTSYAMT
ncbi:MAG: DUF2703 domain-containing protein [Vicinamibacteria bacterium]|nr:DUF2703 domain-containing protein [Vicinamibacteria bacterium]